MAEPAAPRLRRWTRLDHVVQEIRPGDFEVRDQGGGQVGWITSFGTRYQARGIAARLEDAPTLGTFLSGLAALRMVIGYYDTMALRKKVIDEVRQIEKDHELRTQGPLARDPRPGQRTSEPGRTPPARQRAAPARSPR